MIDIFHSTYNCQKMTRITSMPSRQSIQAPDILYTFLREVQSIVMNLQGQRQFSQIRYTEMILYEKINNIFLIFIKNQGQTLHSPHLIILLMLIKKLSKQVINKIAAGQVIQRPYNVIKELVENAIDAEATQIRVNIREGGINLIEIVDNGKGIKKIDFPLLCQRFATSKIADLSDLQTIQSFGFRGEALASLSYVSELQITSKHKDEGLGYRCTFKDEKMVDQPEPLSMNTGTKIKAGQLFANLQIRRSSLNAVQQKKRIIRLLSHFSLHYHYIKFSLESEKGSQLNTDFRNCKISQSKMKVFQIITKLPYDKFTYINKQMLQEMKIEGIITKLNTIKGKVVLLNVNNRIVENQQIIKAVERAYSECYQSIHEDNEHFFVYLSIQLDPKKIDCNQHPSKKIIAFFGADRLYDNIYNWILQHIKQESSIKNIATNIATKGKLAFNINKNMVLNIKSQSQASFNLPDEAIKPQKEQMIVKTQQMSKTQEQKPLYAYEKNRTDSLQMPINFYMKSSKVQISQNMKYLKYNLKVQQANESRTDKIKKFFQEITYVGCFNLNYIFVHLGDRLCIMNILPFLQSFVREWLANTNNRLIIYDILDDYAKMDLRNILYRFIKNKKLQNRVNLNQIIDTILLNKDLIYKQYGISLQQNNQGNNAIITSFPIMQKFMSDCLIEDQLAYFLIRLFIKAPTEMERESYFVDYLVSLFQEREGGEDVKVQEEKGRGQLSPMNDKYSEFFRDKVIPLLKTKGKDWREFAYGEYLTEMMNLKDVYKIFERC